MSTKFEDWKGAKFVEQVKRDIRQLTDNITHAKERYNIDMWDEAFRYMSKRGGKEKMNKEEILFPVIRTCKEDMKDEFEASPKIQLEIEQFTNEQMESIADNMGMLIIDAYWDILREAVGRELNR